jgi:hypothetical protein
MKMEQTVCSETSAYKLQTPCNYSKEIIQKSIFICVCFSVWNKHFTGLWHPVHLLHNLVKGLWKEVISVPPYYNLFTYTNYSVQVAATIWNTSFSMLYLKLYFRCTEYMLMAQFRFMFSAFIYDNYFPILNTDFEVFLVPFWRPVKCDITRVFLILEIHFECWIEFT